MFPPSAPALSTPPFSQSLLLLSSSSKWVVSLMHLEQSEPSMLCWKSMHVCVCVCVLLQMFCAFKCMQEVKCESAAVHHFLNVLWVKRCEFIRTHFNETSVGCHCDWFNGSSAPSPWCLLEAHVLDLSHWPMTLTSTCTWSLKELHETCQEQIAVTNSWSLD